MAAGASAEVVMTRLTKIGTINYGSLVPPAPRDSPRVGRAMASDPPRNGASPDPTEFHSSPRVPEGGPRVGGDAVN